LGWAKGASCLSGILYVAVGVQLSRRVSHELNFSPAGYPDKLLVNYRSNRQLSCEHDENGRSD
jgi:hypothetical protein